MDAAKPSLILADKYSFLNGGIERCLFHLETGLAGQGVEPIPFAVDYRANRPSPYSRFFVPSPSGPDAPHLDKAPRDPLTQAKLLGRALYSFAAKRKLDALLDHLEATNGPDSVRGLYALNIYNYLSPSIFHTAKKRGLPILLLAGDYHLSCANYQHLRDGKPCFLCAGGALLPGLVHRCVKGRALPSFARTLSMGLHRLLGLYDLVDRFAAPCRFMAGTLERLGIRPERIVQLPYPVDPPAEAPDRPRRGFVYFGRLSPEKGVDALIRAYLASGVRSGLTLVGRGFDGEEERLRTLAAGRTDIVFTGFLDGEALVARIVSALASVVPSRWPDNAPLSIDESFGLATPVIGAEIGGIPEQIEPEATGLLFPPDDVNALAVHLRRLDADPALARRLGGTARARILARNNANDYATAILALCDKIRAESKR